MAKRHSLFASSFRIIDYFDLSVQIAYKIKLSFTGHFDLSRFGYVEALSPLKG